MRLCTTTGMEQYRASTAETKEPETLNWIDQYFRPGEIFFDVGANIGLYSLYAAITQPAGKVFAFEPAVRNAAQLAINIHENSLRNVTLCNYAIGAHSGLSTFYLNSLEAGMSMHSLDCRDLDAFGRTPIAAQSVFCATIDEVVCAVGAPSMIKIDVDGRELDIVIGAEKTLRSGIVQTILIEINELPDNSGQKPLEILSQLGYSITTTGRPYSMANAVWKNYILMQRPAAE